jgi:hypothetical protein
LPHGSRRREQLPIAGAVDAERTLGRRDDERRGTQWRVHMYDNGQG